MIKIIFSLLFLFSCAHDNADKLYKNKLYKESLKAYEDILQSNPEDMDAKLGVQKSRSGIISEMVIEARLQRLAGNQKNACDKLVELIDYESKWNDKLDYAAGQSQFKELEYAKSFLYSEIKNHIKNNKALKAHSILFEYSKIFSTAKKDPLYVDLKAQINKLAQSNCSKLSAKINKKSLFYGKYVNKYCGFFGSKLTQIQYDRSSTYSKINIQFTDAPNAIDRNIFSYNMTDSFENSFLYDQKSTQSINLQVKIDSTKIRKSRKKHLIYRYSLEVPYTSYGNQREFKSVPYSVKEKVKVGCKKLENTICLEPIMADKTITKYKSVSKNVQVKETKLRTEYQTLRYPATEHSIKASIKLKASSGLVGFANYYSYQNKFIEHYASFKEASITPQIFKGNGLREFKEESMKAASLSIIDKYRRIWQSKYCSQVSTDNPAREQVFRCLAANEANKKSTSWFIGKFGLSYSSALNLLSQPITLN